MVGLRLWTRPAGTGKVSWSKREPRRPNSVNWHNKLDASQILVLEDDGMESALARVQEVFNQAFGADPQSISLKTTPDDVPGWDSVGHLELASRLEQTFGVSFDVDDLMEMENVREIVKIIEAKL
jgi:acyl carrier protein